MSEVKDMVLSAANYTPIFKPAVGEDFPYDMVGYRYSIKGNEYGSYCYINAGDEEQYKEAVELFRDIAYDAIYTTLWGGVYA